MIHWDQKSALQFASLQGETAKKLLPPERTSKLDPDTVLYLRHNKIYDRSTAILMSLYDIGGWWKLASAGFVLPKFLRDAIYRFVAKTRYQVFGKRDTCRVPTSAEKERLLP